MCRRAELVAFNGGSERKSKSCDSDDQRCTGKGDDEKHRDTSEQRTSSVEELLPEGGNDLSSLVG